LRTLSRQLFCARFARARFARSRVRYFGLKIAVAIGTEPARVDNVRAKQFRALSQDNQLFLVLRVQ
jgi:hypothetical protein